MTVLTPLRLLAALLATLIALFVALSARAQQGPPAAPPVWAAIDRGCALTGESRAGNLPGAIYFSSTIPGFPGDRTWVEADLKPWGVAADTVVVDLQCLVLSTPNNVPYATVNSKGQVIPGPVFTAYLYFAGADDATAPCPGDGSKYAVKATFNRGGGGTRLPFSMTTAVDGGRVKWCYHVDRAAGIPPIGPGGPSLAFTCQPNKFFLPPGSPSTCAGSGP